MRLKVIINLFILDEIIGEGGIKRVGAGEAKIARNPEEAIR